VLLIETDETEKEGFHLESPMGTKIPAFSAAER
jgi:hypothetical protein